MCKKVPNLSFVSSLAACRYIRAYETLEFLQTLRFSTCRLMKPLCCGTNLITWPTVPVSWATKIELTTLKCSCWVYRRTNLMLLPGSVTIIPNSINLMANWAGPNVESFNVSLIWWSFKIGFQTSWNESWVVRMSRLYKVLWRSRRRARESIRGIPDFHLNKNNSSRTSKVQICSRQPLGKTTLRTQISICWNVSKT